MKQIISDNPSEDKGYKTGHRHTTGGRLAYGRGEMPMTYWTKKTILKAVRDKMFSISKNSDMYRRYQTVMTTTGRTHEEIVNQLNNTKLSDLRQYLLGFRGTHYTGSHYRYTKFYGIVDDLTFLSRLVRNIIEHREIIQLHLFEVNNDKQKLAQ